MNSSLVKFIGACLLCIATSGANAQYDSVFKIPYPQRYAVIKQLVYSETDSTRSVSEGSDR
jgi:hypothetical protein